MKSLFKIVLAVLTFSTTAATAAPNDPDCYTAALKEGLSRRLGFLMTPVEWEGRLSYQINQNNHDESEFVVSIQAADEGEPVDIPLKVTNFGSCTFAPAGKPSFLERD